MTEITHTENTPASLRELRRFLSGEAALDGVHFGDRHPQYRGAFWWRGWLNIMERAATELDAARQDQGGKTSGGEVEPVQCLHELAAPGGEQEAVAYLWTLFMEGGQTAKRLEWNDRDDPWGQCGKDYDPSYHTSVQPLAILASPVLDVEDQGSSLEGLPHAKAHAPTLSQDGKWMSAEPTREMWAAAGDAVVRLQVDGHHHHDKYSEAVYRAMWAAAPQPPESGWRTDMENAPRDGTPILAWTVHQNAAFAKDAIGDGWACASVIRWIDHNGGGWTWNGLAGAHTHWRPLPDPPAAPQLPEGKG